MSRLVKVVSQASDTRLKVRVYFKSTDPRQEPMYYGQTEIPMSLMNPKSEKNKDFGFSIWDREAEVQVYLAARAPKVRDEEREQDDLDFWNEQEAA